MPELKKELEKARSEWSTLVKESTSKATDAQKMKKLEANMVEIEKAMPKL